MPALGAGVLRLGPGPAWWLALAGGLLLVSLLAALRPAGPGWAARRAGRGPGSVLATAVLGSLAMLAAAIAWAAWRAEEAPTNEESVRHIYDVDASVATRPLPRCSATPASSRVVLEDGARPRLSGDGAYLWFDAAVDGARQVQRLERKTGQVLCWTCGEEGNNWRPHPGLGGASLLFETDRFATWLDPTNTEIHLIDARGESPPPGSRRLTVSAGPDDHALFAPGSPAVLWSRRDEAGYRVVAARLRTGHGGISLGRPALLDAAGPSWTAPLDWSPDARSLILVRGNPLAALAAESLDLAEGRATPLGAARVGGADFTADGGWLVLASAQPRAVAGWLPASLGLVLAPLATALGRDAALHRGTRLRVGEPRGEQSELEIGDIATWGEPTGVSLGPDGDWLVLGQRRNGEERILEIELDCRPS